MPDDIRIKNISNKIFPPLIKKENAGKLQATILLEVSAPLDVRHCPKLQSRKISRKTNDANLRK